MLRVRNFLFRSSLFALVALWKRATRAKWALLFSLFQTQDQFALFNAICSFFLDESYQLGWKNKNKRLCSFKFSALLALLKKVTRVLCSCRSLQKKRRAKVQFTFLSKKTRAIRTKNQSANSQPFIWVKSAMIM